MARGCGEGRRGGDARADMHAITPSDLGWGIRHHAHAWDRNGQRAYDASIYGRLRMSVCHSASLANEFKQNGLSI
jgi:hypothetical protein